MDLETPLNTLVGIGPGIAYRLGKLGLNTVGDLIYHFPFRYEDFSNSSTALEANIGERVTLKGEIWSIKNIFTRSRRIITQAIFNDGTSPIQLTWFNQSWLTKQIKTGDRLQVSGKLQKYKNKLSIIMPVWEKISALPNTKYEILNTNLHTGRLVPVYPETEGLTSKWLRTKISQVLPNVIAQIKDSLPDETRDDMMTLEEAIEQIHLPKDYASVEKARERLGFDELFFIALATLKARQTWQKKDVVEPLKPFSKEIEEFIRKLPFQLTRSQEKVIKEIMEDLKKDKPMNRLLQGEVGSGKTVVATIIIYLAYLNGLKTLFMAPTEILAFQHYSTVSKLLEPFGIKVGIYTGSRKYNKSQVSRVKSQKKQNTRLSTLAAGDLTPDVLIGTHALLSSKLNTENVGLIIVDEQQRFGVEQRALLRSRAKLPHFLTTTATPIPRTVALTIYGDLDMSVIDELPKERLKIKTFVVPSKKRLDAYGFIEKQIKAGDQAYIITPLIEQSETLTSVRAATIEFEKLKSKIFPKLNLGLLHGRLKSKEKESVMNDFKNGKIDILVSTSVVEVGVDVSNASIMVIESAERFGLAQLHQLRGRVGRGHKQSYCLLFSDGSPQEVSRLKNLEKLDEGLKLAELDLKIRGSGEIFGTKQSGRFELKIASLYDLPMVEKTRKAAQTLLKKDPQLDKYPLLAAKLHSISGNVMPD